MEQKNVRILILTTLYFLKIYNYKNTRNHHQRYSILTILFYFFFLEQDGLKIEIYKIRKKEHPRDIIILHNCNKTQTHMISASRDIGL